MSFINTWGATLEKDFVVQEDLSKYNLGATIKCISEEDDILICQYDKENVRILKKGWEMRKTPDFGWGDFVKIKEKSIIAKIELICWHYNEERYFYHLVTENGKKLSKRYYTEEIEKVFFL